MGTELAPFTEWDHQRELEWFLLDFDAHAAHCRYVAALNHLYLASPPLYELDFSPEGFSWIDPDNDAQSVYSYVRTDRAGKCLLVVLNFSNQGYTDYRVGVPRAGVYTEIFSSDARHFGGAGTHNPPCPSAPIPIAHAKDSISLTLPPLSALIFSVL